MFGAYLLSIDFKPTLEEVTKWYNDSMMIKPTIWFCKKAGKNKFSVKDIENMKKTAKMKSADANSYSWNMDFLPYENDKGYEARFYKCGICYLLKELNLFEYTPAMCHLDYAMTDAGKVSEFKRKYTLASGGPYCDCGYYKKENKL